MNAEATRRLTNAERKERTRSALLAAASREFAERGFAGARVEAIAERAGLTTGALYAHFRDKTALFLAVYERYAAGRARDVAAAGDPGRDGRRSLRAAADQWMERFDAEPWGLRLHFEFTEHARRDPELRRDFALRVGAVRDAAAEVIRSAAEEAGAELPMSAESLAAVTRALGIGLAAERSVDPEAVPPELFGDFVELLFSLLLDPKEPE